MDARITKATRDWMQEGTSEIGLKLILHDKIHLYPKIWAIVEDET